MDSENFQMSISGEISIRQILTECPINLGEMKVKNHCKCLNKVKIYFLFIAISSLTSLNCRKLSFIIFIILIKKNHKDMTKLLLYVANHDKFRFINNFLKNAHGNRVPFVRFSIHGLVSRK